MAADGISLTCSYPRRPEPVDGQEQSHVYRNSAEVSNRHTKDLVFKSWRTNIGTSKIHTNYVRLPHECRTYSV